MICDKCAYNNRPITAVPSCALPHCIKPINDIAKEIARLTVKSRSAEEEAEYRMLREEISGKHHGA